MKYIIDSVIIAVVEGISCCESFADHELIASTSKYWELKEMKLIVVWPKALNVTNWKYNF